MRGNRDEGDSNVWVEEPREPKSFSSRGEVLSGCFRRNDLRRGSGGMVVRKTNGTHKKEVP